MDSESFASMSWAVGYDDHWKRDIGYGVPAQCDYPGCGKRIDRGLSYVCGGEPYGGEEGCGLFFCDEHLSGASQCERCYENRNVCFEPTDDVEEWLRHKLTDESWKQWRDENADEVARIRRALEMKA